jgi:cytidylate kinase
MTARSLDALIERQVHQWQAARKAAERRARPCISISRQPGTGGEDLGRRLAERLGYGYFEREIVDAIAKKTGVAEHLVASLDERLRSQVERYVVDAFRRQALTESVYLRALATVVSTLTEGGGAVIVGRGANFVAAPERTLRVLLVAPAAFRAQRAARAHELSAEAALEAVEKGDAERRAFIRHHFGVDQLDPTLHDIALNVAQLPEATLDRVVLEALHGRFPDAKVPLAER